MTKAICVLKCKSNHIHGIINLIQKSNGISINIRVQGINPGLHGFHIHRCGNETQGCESMCEHYNPTGKKHGNLNDIGAHRGDLGNILADRQGIVDQTIHAKLLTIDEILGRSMIVHADEDDLGLGGKSDSDTTGHSGKRILCGIIGRND